MRHWAWLEHLSPQMSKPAPSDILSPAKPHLLQKAVPPNSATPYGPMGAISFRLSQVEIKYECDC